MAAYGEDSLVTRCWSSSEDNAGRKTNSSRELLAKASVETSDGIEDTKPAQHNWKSTQDHEPNEKHILTTTSITMRKPQESPPPFHRKADGPRSHSRTQCPPSRSSTRRRTRGRRRRLVARLDHPTSARVRMSSSRRNTPDVYQCPGQLYRWRSQAIDQ